VYRSLGRAYHGGRHSTGDNTLKLDGPDPDPLSGGLDRETQAPEPSLYAAITGHVAMAAIPEIGHRPARDRSGESSVSCPSPPGTGPPLPSDCGLVGARELATIPFGADAGLPPVSGSLNR
jgi:hypothetical protein